MNVNNSNDVTDSSTSNSSGDHHVEEQTNHVEDQRSTKAITTPTTEEKELSNVLIGLIAHNNLKPAMIQFVKENIDFFKKIRLVTTESTGRALSGLGLPLNLHSTVSSGPLGGDLEVGAMIVRDEITAVIFLVDPLTSHPHEADIFSLQRICCLYDLPLATNIKSARALIFSLEFGFFSVFPNPSPGEGEQEVNEKKDVLGVFFSSSGTQTTASSKRRDHFNIIQKYKFEQEKYIADVVVALQQNEVEKRKNCFNFVMSLFQPAEFTKRSP